MRSKLTVAKLKEILDQYDDESIVKVFDRANVELTFIDKIVSKMEGDSKYPDVIFEIQE